MSIVTVDANPQHWLRHQTNRKYCSWIGFVDGSGSPSVLLCVDDQETVLEIRKRLLEAEGYRVLTATAAHEALEIFRANHVDLVLTEHIVSTPSGPTLAKTMKMLKPEVPVAIYSADWEASPDDMQSADMFITKLVSVDELLSMIAKLLRKGQSAKAA